jgi:hypothetical protein
VYEPIPTIDALRAFDAAATGAATNNAPSPDAPALRPSLLSPACAAVNLGRSAGDRLRSDDQREFRLVAQRLALRLTSTDFADRMRESVAAAAPAEEGAFSSRSAPDGDGDRAGTATTPTDAMVEAVERALSRLIDIHGEGGDAIAGHLAGPDPSLPPWMPPTVDLFVQDRIFRPASDGNGTGIESAQANLRRECSRESGHRRPVAWGNTNTRPREYKCALQVAEETSRPVHFVTYLDGARPCGNVEFEDDVFALRGDAKELLRRNVDRFLRTGRFVPSHVIHAMSQRTNNLVKMVVDHWKAQNVIGEAGVRNGYDPARQDEDLVTRSGALAPRKVSKFEFDRILARFANFDMNADRTVVHTYPPNPRKYRRDETNRTISRHLHRTERESRRSPEAPRSTSDATLPSDDVARRPWHNNPRQVRPRLEFAASVASQGNCSGVSPEDRGSSRRDRYPAARPRKGALSTAAGGTAGAAAGAVVHPLNATNPRVARREGGGFS